MPKVSEGAFALGSLAVLAVWLFVGLPLLLSGHPLVPSILPGAKDFWIGITGTLVGGLISAIVAYRIQARAFREAQQQRDDDRLLTRRALGHSLLFKVIQIHSDFDAVQQALKDCFAKAEKAGIKVEPWAIFIPPANIFDFVNFTADEMGMLLSFKEDKVFNHVAGLDTKHNSIAKVLTVYSAERRALGEKMKPVAVDGTIFSGNFDISLRPRMVELNGLVEMISTDGKTYAEDSGTTLDLLNGALRKHLGLGYRLEKTQPKVDG